MSAVPSQALLEAAVNQTFHIETTQAPVPVVLQKVSSGIGMNERYTCYAASFVLPAGLSGPQGTYRVRHPEGEVWELFMTPILPGPDGCHRLQAVFHYEKAAPASA